MSRLTKTFRNGEVHTLRTCCAPYYKKLSQLEDIEDEIISINDTLKFDIDLITILKCLVQGIYVKKERTGEIVYIEPVRLLLDLPNQSVAVYNNIFYTGEDGLEEEMPDGYCDLSEEYNFNYYGKTWALTKEELL